MTQPNRDLAVIVPPGASRGLFALGFLHRLTWLRPFVKIIGGTSVGGVVGAGYAMNALEQTRLIFYEDLVRLKAFFSLYRWISHGRPGDLDGLIAACQSRFPLNNLDESPIKAFTGYYDYVTKQIVYKLLGSADGVESIRRSAANIVLSPLIDGRYTDAGLLEYLPTHLFTDDGPWPTSRVLVLDYNSPEVRIPDWVAKLGRAVLPKSSYVRLATEIPIRYHPAIREIKAWPDRYFLVEPDHAPLGFNPLAQSRHTVMRIYEEGVRTAATVETSLRKWLDATS